MNRKAFPMVLLAVVALAFTASRAAADGDTPGYSMEDVTACSPDAMRICKDKLPDVEAIEACMKAHYDELQPQCQARFKR